MLARAPERVTVRETLEAFETLAPVPCLAVRSAPRPAATEGEDPEEGCTLDILEITCPTRAAWHLVDQRVRRTLEELTLDDLLHEVHRHGLTDEMAAHVR
jgi:DNA-binding IscR family transcriptional regulator